MGFSHERACRRGVEQYDKMREWIARQITWSQRSRSTRARALDACFVAHGHYFARHGEMSMSTPTSSSAGERPEPRFYAPPPTSATPTTFWRPCAATSKPRPSMSSCAGGAFSTEISPPGVRPHLHEAAFGIGLDMIGRSPKRAVGAIHLLSSDDDLTEAPTTTKTWRNRVRAQSTNSGAQTGTVQSLWSVFLER